MDINVDKGSIEDLRILVEMRIDYIREDYSSVSDEQIEEIKEALPDYYSRHINKDLHIYKLYTWKSRNCFECLHKTGI